MLYKSLQLWWVYTDTLILRPWGRAFDVYGAALRLLCCEVICPEISALEVVICPSWAMEMRARCPRRPHKRTVVDIHINSVLWLDCHREGWSCANVFLFFFQKYFPANHGTALNALYVIQFSHVFPVSKSKKYILCNVFHMYFCCADHFLRFLGACYLWCQVVASDFDPHGL